MPTPIGSLSPYCSASEFLDHYDARTVGDYIKDDNSRATESDLKDSSTRVGARLLSLLKKASGLIESAALAGHRYTALDLAALTGNSKELLVGLTADLTLWLLLNRRPNRVGEVPQQCQFAVDMLEKLRGGERIFALDSQATAGKEVEIVPAEEGELLTDRARRFFGDPFLC